MRYGISTGRARLDTAFVPDENEIDWLALTQWFDVADEDPPEFAGRYFLGSPDALEIAERRGFCRWAHGEGVRSLAPRAIVPIQRADPRRQSAAGSAGSSYGAADAITLALEIDACLAVGDLQLPGDRQVYVFLEVADDTSLSPEYWRAWSTTIFTATLTPQRFADRVGPNPAPPTQVLLPAILCGFAFDGETGKFLPDKKVRDCLDASRERGWHPHCLGFWARRHATAPVPPAVDFTWSTLGTYAQPRGIAGIRIGVPALYLRGFDSLATPPATGVPVVPAAGTLRATLDLVTIDWPTTTGHDPLLHTLMATDWAADATQLATQPNEPDPFVETPAQLGIDCSVNLTARATTIGCLLGADLVAKRMPYDDWAPEQRSVDLARRCSFAFRYYAPSGPKRLTRDEALALSMAGIGIAVIWEGNAESRDWPTHVGQLIAPFVNRRGRADGLAAFTYAAETIDQPPSTPIYFGVDFPVGIETPGDYLGVPTIALRDVLDYFRDVQLGYLDHLERLPDRPYSIGVYGQRSVIAALYRLGLASHFWQVPWSGWDGSHIPFAHLNAWQISTSAVADMAQDNRALQRCARLGAGDLIWFDLNVAWGDPGTFQVLP